MLSLLHSRPCSSFHPFNISLPFISNLSSSLFFLFTFILLFPFPDLHFLSYYFYIISSLLSLYHSFFSLPMQSFIIPSHSSLHYSFSSLIHRLFSFYIFPLLFFSVPAPYHFFLSLFRSFIIPPSPFLPSQPFFNFQPKLTSS